MVLWWMRMMMIQIDAAPFIQTTHFTSYSKNIVCVCVCMVTGFFHSFSRWIYIDFFQYQTATIKSRHRTFTEFFVCWIYWIDVVYTLKNSIIVGYLILQDPYTVCVIMWETHSYVVFFLIVNSWIHLVNKSQHHHHHQLQPQQQRV